MEIVGYLILVLSGITLALIGGGGSLLSTPVMIYFFQMNALQATTYSLFVVALGSAFGAFSYVKQKYIDIPLAIEFALPCFVSIYLVRMFAISSVPEVFDFFSFHCTRDIAIMFPFGIVMSTAAIKALKKGYSKKFEKRPGKLTAIVQGLIVGAITGFVGVGGGFIITPILHFVMGLDFKRAVGTSLFVLTLNSTFGFSVDLIRGADVSLGLLALFASASIIGLAIGFQIAKHIKETSLKFAFSLILVVIAVGILADYSYRFYALNF